MTNVVREIVTTNEFPNERTLGNNVNTTVLL